MSILNSAKNTSKGRPRVDSEAVNVRLERDFLAAIDRWIGQQADPKPLRPEAIRTALKDWLTGLGLLPAHDTPEGANGHTGETIKAAKVEARHVAEDAVDAALDQVDATADEKAKRKKRLTKLSRAMKTST
jgi:hypothetical protein